MPCQKMNKEPRAGYSVQVTASSIKGAMLSNIEALLERGLDFSRARQVKSLMPIMNFVTSLTRRTVT